MTALLRELAARIRGEVVELDRVVGRVLGAWERVGWSPGEWAFVDSAALNLHSFYSGAERVLRRFRHRVRNLDASNLAPEKMAGLVATLPKLWGSLRAELMAFAEFLDEID